MNSQQGDSQSKDDKFLKSVADDFNFSGDTRVVFLVCFKRGNETKKPSELVDKIKFANPELKNKVQTILNRKGDIYKAFRVKYPNLPEPKIGGQEKGKSPSQIAFQFLWEQMFPKFLAEDSDAKLTNINLSNSDLSCQDLSRRDMSHSILRKTKLCSATMHYTILFGADMHGTDARNAELLNADMRHTILHGADLRGANLQGANLRGADLRSSKIDDRTQLDANYLAIWQIVNQGNNDQRLNRQHKELQGANLQGANLQGANLQGANLQDANLQDANLQGANLQDANLQGANLQDANLQGANLQDANLQGANLQGANIQDVDLRNTNLSFAVGLADNMQPVLMQRGAYFEDYRDERPIRLQRDDSSSLKRQAVGLSQSVIWLLPWLFWAAVFTPVVINYERLGLTPANFKKVIPQVVESIEGYIVERIFKPRKSGSPTPRPTPRPLPLPKR